jgi:hypothetical protein
MVLRQCSKALQQLVDATGGIALVLYGDSSDAQHALALALSAAALTRLDTRKLPEDAPVQQLLQAVAQAAGGLPQLRQLTCNLEHLELLNAVAAVSPQLSCLTLGSQQGDSEDESDSDSQQEQSEDDSDMADSMDEQRIAELLERALPGGWV